MRVLGMMSDRRRLDELGVGGWNLERALKLKGRRRSHWHVKIRRSAECKIHHGCTHRLPAQK